MPRGQDTRNHPNRRASKVVIISPARQEPASEEDIAESLAFANKKNLQTRYENVDRSVNFPMKRA